MTGWISIAGYIDALVTKLAIMKKNKQDHADDNTGTYRSIFLLFFLLLPLLPYPQTWLSSSWMIWGMASAI